jgi:type IV pilus assembly protein PilE
MVAIVIMAIVVAAAMPSYRKYILRTNRSVARNFLVDIAAKEEAYAAQNAPTHGYSNNFYDLIGKGSSSTKTVYLDNAGTISTSTGTGYVYSVAITTAVTPPLFTITATVMNKQASDASCQTISLDQLGVKSQSPTSSGGNSDCWNR